MKKKNFASFASSRSIRAWLFVVSCLSVAPAGAFTLDEGARAYEGRDYGKAEEIFRERAVDSPGDQEALYNLGNSLYRQGRFDEAEQAYSEALRADPKLADGWYNLGNSLYRQDRFKDSIRAYAQALKLGPKDPDALHNLRRTERKLKENPQADKSRPQEMPGSQPTPPPQNPRGTAKEKSGDGKQDAGDKKKGDRWDVASKRTGKDPNTPRGNEASDESRREGEARREQARKELGLNDSQVDQLLSRMERQERQLQPYFRPNAKRPQREDDMFNMMPREQAEMMRRFFGRRMPNQRGPAGPKEDW